MSQQGRSHERNEIPGRAIKLSLKTSWDLLLGGKPLHFGMEQQGLAQNNRCSDLAMETLDLNLLEAIY